MALVLLQRPEFGLQADVKQIKYAHMMAAELERAEIRISQGRLTQGINWPPGQFDVGYEERLEGLDKLIEMLNRAEGQPAEDISSA
ncbi:hypothetical protein HY357_01375 [Candidatus Roizmanbacteria bacterium]|nr:hypothetical protein [Candidatus Roizmanbacteria bacterium]